MQKKQPSAPQDSKRQPREETHLEGLASITSMIIIWSFVMGFVLQNFVIPSASMASTLLVGDHVIVERATLAPAGSWTNLIPYRELRRDEPVVFFRPAPNPEGQHDILVKRVIGIPGDRIHLRNGVVYLNGVAQNEPQAGMPASDDNPQHAFNAYRDDFPAVPPGPYDQVTASWAYELPNHIVDGDLVVPPGKVFAMGDNRTESLDGRFWGFVPRENIVGRPMFVYWSFETPADQINKQSIGERIGFMGHILLHIFDETRWKRTFHLVK